MMSFQKVARLSELWSGEKVGLRVEGKRVLLVNVDGTVYAYEDKCPHLGVALSDGRLDGARLTCRAHHWEYDLCAGISINPATAKLRPVPVRLENDDVLVDIECLRSPLAAEPAKGEGTLTVLGASSAVNRG
jgi:toluene monooxygenase system ferredoxin subunit